ARPEPHGGRTVPGSGRRHRVGQVIAQMTRAEKLAMVHGALKEPAGVVGPIIAPYVNAVLSVTGLPPLEVLGRPVP
ncbi:MAG: hypothetical protein ACRDKS_04220, partial [Actinomycetota bacterium]